MKSKTLLSGVYISEPDTPLRHGKKTKAGRVSPTIDLDETVEVVDTLPGVSVDKLKSVGLDRLPLMLVVGKDTDELFRLQKIISQLRSTIRHLEESQIQALVDATVPLLATRPSQDELDEIMAGVAERRTFLIEYNMFDAEELHAFYDSKSANKFSLANNWRNTKKVFAVEHQNKLGYPKFQFAHGRPKPVVQDILKALPSHWSSWDIALWFSRDMAALDGETPAASIDKQPQAVVAAAKSV